MRYSSLILSAMLIITFTACNKGGKENDIAHETPISEETTMTIGSTETTSTAQITSAMSTKPITTVIKTETTPSTRVAIKDVFDISEKTNQMDWLETFEVPIAISKPDEDTAYFFCHLNYKFTNGSWQEGMIEYLGGREFWEEFTALSGAVPIISTDLLDYPNDFSFIIKYDVPNDIIAKGLEANNKYKYNPQYTEEEMAAILSRDAATVLRYFAPEEAIVIRDKVYTPAWVYTHKIEDYVAVGITPAMVEEKLELYVQFPLTGEARGIFETKLSKFLGREVLLNWKHPQLP